MFPRRPRSLVPVESTVRLAQVGASTTIKVEAAADRSENPSVDTSVQPRRRHRRSRESSPIGTKLRDWPSWLRWIRHEDDSIKWDGLRMPNRRAWTGSA